MPRSHGREARSRPQARTDGRVSHLPNRVARL